MNKERKSRGVAKKLTPEEKYPRTISLKVFSAWKDLKRMGDSKLLVNKGLACRPIIDRALNFGHVKSPKLEKKISKFFTDRAANEEKENEELLSIVAKERSKKVAVKNP